MVWSCVAGHLCSLSVSNEFSAVYYITPNVIASSKRHLLSHTVSEVQESGSSLAGASG